MPETRTGDSVIADSFVAEIAIDYARTLQHGQATWSNTCRGTDVATVTELRARAGYQPDSTLQHAGEGGQRAARRRLSGVVSSY